MIDDPVLPDDEFDESGIRGAAALGQEPNDTEPDADSDDLDVISGDVADPQRPEHPMVFKEGLDFTQQAPPAAPPAALRLRAPDLSGKAPAAGPTPLPPRAPAPSPKDMDWAQLGDALKNAERSRGESRAYESLFANVGAQSGYRPNPHAGDAEVDMAKLPLEMNAQRQASEGRELGLQSQKAAQGVKAAMDDPNSLQSQKARDAVKAMGVKLPAGFDNYSASDIHNFVKTGELANLERIRSEAENKRRDDETKALAAKTKAEGEAKTLEASRKNYAKELKALGVDPATASQKDIDRAISIGHNKATERMAEGNFAIARSNEQRKAGDYAALGQGIPFAGSELKYTGQGTPRAEDVDKAQGIASTYGAALSGMDDLGQKIEAFAKNPTPANKDAMASAARITGGHLNTAFGQGAMSQDEANAMSQVLGSDIKTAAGVQALYDKIMGDDEQAAKALGRRLKAARENTRASALGKLRAYRFEAQGGGKTVKVKFPNGKTVDVPEGEVDEATSKYKGTVVGG